MEKDSQNLFGGISATIYQQIFLAMENQMLQAAKIAGFVVGRYSEEHFHTKIVEEITKRLEAELHPFLPTSTWNVWFTRSNETQDRHMAVISGTIRYSCPNLVTDYYSNNGLYYTSFGSPHITLLLGRPTTVPLQLQQYRVFIAPGTYAWTKESAVYFEDMGEYGVTHTREAKELKSLWTMGFFGYRLMLTVELIVNPGENKDAAILQSLITLSKRIGFAIILTADAQGSSGQDRSQRTFIQEGILSIMP